MRSASNHCSVSSSTSDKGIMLRQGILEGKTEGGQVPGSDEQQKCPMLPLHPLYDRMKGVSPHADGSPNDACPGHKRCT